MKNVNSLFKNDQKQPKGKRIIFFVLLLLLAAKSYSQPFYTQPFSEIMEDAKDDWTNNANWVFSIDDNCNQQFQHGAFSWCANGGRYLEDVMMTLRKSDESIALTGDTFELKVAGSLILKNKDTRMADWDNLSLWADGFYSHIQSNGDDNGMIISSNLGNKIKLGDSNDAITINGKYVIMDYGGDNDVAQVAINAGNPVNGAALTVGGMTYIGSSKTIEANPEIGNDLKADCSLFVEKQILASDLNIIPKLNWKDCVFESNYKKMDLNALESFVKENKHLPGIVSEKEVQEKGYKVHVFNEGLLQNVEELLLHIIDQNKKIETLSKKIEALERESYSHK